MTRGHDDAMTLAGASEFAGAAAFGGGAAGGDGASSGHRASAGLGLSMADWNGRPPQGAMIAIRGLTKIYESKVPAYAGIDGGVA